MFQAPEELGEFTDSVYTHVIAPTHAASKEVFAAFTKLTNVCEEVLKFGSRPDREEQIQKLVQEVEVGR